MKHRLVVFFLFLSLLSSVYADEIDELLDDNEFCFEDLMHHFLFEHCSPPCEDPVEPEFYDLSLQNAIQIALKQNRQLLAILDSLRGSRMLLDFEETAFDIQVTPETQTGYVGGGKVGGGFTIGGGVRVAKKFVSGTKVSIFPAITRLRKSYRTNITASLVQPLLRGFGSDFTLASIKRAKYGYRSACRNYYIAQIGLIVRTIQSLYEVVKLEGIVRLNEQSVERVKGYSDAAILKEKIALCDSLDVYRAAIELKNAQESLNVSLERLQEAKDHVRDLLALPMDCELQVEVPLEYHPVEICTEEAIEQAFANRLEVEQANDHIDETSRIVMMSRKNLLPDLNLIVDYSNVGSNEYFTRSFYDKRESTWGIGFGSSSDWHQFSERYQYDQSILSLDAAYRSMDQLKQNISMEVKRILRNLRRGHIRIQLLEEQIVMAESEMQLAKVKFQHGLANNFDVIQSERTLHSAYQNLLSAEIEHVINEFQLLGVLGTISNKPRIHDKTF